jgi:hypothetical protein
MLRWPGSEVLRLCYQHGNAREILNRRPKCALKQEIQETIEWSEKSWSDIKLTNIIFKLDLRPLEARGLR